MAIEVTDGSAPAGIVCISGVSMTYFMCVRASAWPVRRIACWAFVPVFASAVENARRNEWKSTRRLVGVSWCTSWRATPARSRSRRRRLANDVPRWALPSPLRGPRRTGNTGPATGRLARSHHARRKGRSTSGMTRSCGAAPLPRGTLHVANASRSIELQSHRTTSIVRMPPWARATSAIILTSRSPIGAARYLVISSSFKITRSRSSDLIGGIFARVTGLSFRSPGIADSK
jgi:hypothetical protein